MKTVPFQYTYANLPESFYQTLVSSDVRDPRLLKWNTELAADLGIEDLRLEPDEKARIFSGSAPSAGSKLVAQAYSGHQFGHFNPRLGDGRALLLGELKDRRGRLKDIHLKGSGRTRFSRGGDGKATLAAAIREYLVSEGMTGLGIPSSRSLAILSTGESVQREVVHRGAILVRVASSHVRVGTFEYFTYHGDRDSLRRLADFVIDRHDPDLSKTSEGYIELFRRIVDRQAALVARWMGVGFIHGVMNTDNTFVSGETLDYGPCAFMEEYDPKAVFSSIDRFGRYAYAQQPPVLQWNLMCLGGCFLFLIDPEDPGVRSRIESIIAEFESIYNSHYVEVLKPKFGFDSFGSDEGRLAGDFLDLLHAERLDFTNSFRDLSESVTADPPTASPAHREWLARWRARLATQNEATEKIQERMNRANPAYIPRNHRVEEAIQAASARDDFSAFDRLLEVVKDPYVEREAFKAYRDPAAPHERVTETFCNT